MREYWYFTTYYECPVCGSQHTVRERRYTPRPEDDEDRYTHVQWYDNCDIEI